LHEPFRVQRFRVQRFRVQRFRGSGFRGLGFRVRRLGTSPAADKLWQIHATIQLTSTLQKSEGFRVKRSSFVK